MLVYVQHTTQVLQKEEKLKGFIHNLLIQLLYKYNHLSLSYISSTSTDAVPNKYISKPSIPKRTWSNFLAIFRECQHIALEKKKKVRPRSTELTITTKQYEHSTRTAHVHQRAAVKSSTYAKKNWINNTRDSHLVPHGSTKRASSDLASKFGMGFGAVHSLWSLTILSTSRTYIKSFQ